MHLAWERGSKLKEVSQATAAMLSHLSDAQLATVTFRHQRPPGRMRRVSWPGGKDEVAKRLERRRARLGPYGVIDEPPGGSYAELCSVAVALSAGFTAPGLACT